MLRYLFNGCETRPIFLGFSYEKYLFKQRNTNAIRVAKIDQKPPG